MKKKVISFLVAMSLMVAALPAQVKATEVDTRVSPEKQDILEIAADGGGYLGSILVGSDGSVCAEDGDLLGAGFFGLTDTILKAMYKVDILDEYLEKLGYDVYFSDSGDLLVESAYQSCRLFVTGVNLQNYYGALSRVESGGISLLTYGDLASTKHAAEELEKSGYEVSPDPILELNDSLDATNYTYAGDVLGQYGKTVTESSGVNTMSLPNELMGLTNSAKNIVDAQALMNIGSVGVAVIDSGVDASAVGLQGRVRTGYNVVSGTSNTKDDCGHGTFVASIIANNTPTNVGIVPIKVADSEAEFTASNLATALQYIINNSNGINVVNLSLSLCTLDATQMTQAMSFINPYIDQLYSKGILVVTSAGNKSTTYPSMTAQDSYPANYDKCIAVGALAYSSGTWGVYSQSLTGSCIDYWAPGKFVRGSKSSVMNMTQATAATGWSGEWLDLGDGTCLMSGTSQATPFVSAALAHILSYDNRLGADEQRTLLCNNSTSAGASGVYPEMSGYFYTVGAYNSATGGYSGVISNWDALIDTAAGTITLVKYTGNDSNVLVPATFTVNGRELKTILGNSTATTGPFAGNTNIKSVAIADGVSFRNNDASYAFYTCTGLQQYPEIPSSVTRMDYIFYGCKNARGESKVLSSDVSSAVDAYRDAVAQILVPANSTTYATFSKLYENWSGTTLNNSSASGDNTKITGIGFGVSKIAVEKGGTYQLTVTITPSTVKNATVQWSSSDNKVVTVNENGLITGVGLGNAVITAVAGAHTAQCNVTVSGSLDDAEKYTVTYYYRNVNVNKVTGGKVVKTTTNARGYIDRPKNPTKSGYYFAGWFIKGSKGLELYSFEDTKVTANTKLYAKWVSKKIGSTSITSLKKSGKKEITVSFKKATNATHYQIYISSHSNFQNGAVLRTTKTTKVVKQLVARKKWVKVRGCRKLGGVWYYGKWSKPKTVKL